MEKLHIGEYDHSLFASRAKLFEESLPEDQRQLLQKSKEENAELSAEESRKMFEETVYSLSPDVLHDFLKLLRYLMGETDEMPTF